MSTARLGHDYIDFCEGSGLRSVWLEEQAHRVLEQPLELPQILLTQGSVDYPVIARESGRHDLAHYHLSVADDRLFCHLAHRDDRSLRRINHRDERIHSEHPEVGNGDRSTGVFLRLESSLARSLRQVTSLSGDGRQALLICVSDDWGDQTFLDRNGDPDIDVLILQLLVSLQGHVHFWHPSKRDRSRLHYNVIDRHLRFERFGFISDLHRRVHLNIDRQIEVRNTRLDVSQSLRNHPPHRADRNHLGFSPLDRKRHARARSETRNRGPVSERFFNISLDDPTLRSRALQRGQVQSPLLRYSFRKR